MHPHKEDEILVSQTASSTQSACLLYFCAFPQNVFILFHCKSMQLGH
jgi:hypothetical protein